MARTDVLSEVRSVYFSAVSTPRRIRLITGDRTLPDFYDYISIQHRADTVVFVGTNGASASSTASTFVVLPQASPNKQVFAVFKTGPLQLWTHATSLSIQAAGATAVSCEILVGRV